MNEYFKITEKLKMENASMRNDALELKKQIDNLEYTTRSNNIDIYEVPEKNNENLVDVVTKIGRFLNMSLDPDSIDTAFRVPSRAENKPKNIVVKFKFKQSLDYFLTAAKVARKDPHNQRGFNLDGISNRFFINEHLPPKTKMLLKQIREEAKNKNYRFV
ncbi:hypothetical protein JTB14_032220 [Gonioctena quinquepunctata]|nr:hypothetical protein JTB14_032220 [Gonioctena quinquepunctata]